MSLSAHSDGCAVGDVERRLLVASHRQPGGWTHEAAMRYGLSFVTNEGRSLVPGGTLVASKGVRKSVGQRPYHWLLVFFFISNSFCLVGKQWGFVKFVSVYVDSAGMCMSDPQQDFAMEIAESLQEHAPDTVLHSAKVESVGSG